MNVFRYIAPRTYDFWPIDMIGEFGVLPEPFAPLPHPIQEKMT